MTNTPSLEDTLKAAQGLVETRLAAVEEHKRNVDAESEARAVLAERERESARTWAALLAAGWTPAELRRIPGFVEPKTKLPGRPRTKVKPAAGPGHAGAELPSQHGSSPSTEAPGHATPA